MSRIRRAPRLNLGFPAMVRSGGPYIAMSPTPLGHSDLHHAFMVPRWTVYSTRDAPVRVEARPGVAESEPRP